MNITIAHITDIDILNGFYYQSIDKYKSKIAFSDTDYFKKLDNNENLIFLVPSQLLNVFSHKYKEEISKKNNQVSFISDIDSILATDVSKNEFLFFKDNVFVIDKFLYQSLTKKLNELNCRVYLMPDYFLIQDDKNDSVVQLDQRVLFSFSDGTGTSIEIDSLDEYLNILDNTKPNFDPRVFYYEKKEKNIFKESSNTELFSYKFIEKNYLKLPNFYTFKFTLLNIFRKLSFSYFQFYFCIFLIIFSLVLPYIYIFQNNKYTEIYETETFEIFKSLDKNTKRVVSPMRQIDEIADQINISNERSINDTIFSDLEFLTKLGENFLEKVEIDFDKNIAIIEINNIPEIQYRALKNISNNLDINILEDNVVIEKNKAEGKIKIEFKND